jgi:hypothetical protein
MFILIYPVNFPCGRKPQHPEKSHDFRQGVDWLFSHGPLARIEPMFSEVKSACSDYCATEAPVSCSDERILDPSYVDVSTF